MYLQKQTVYKEIFWKKKKNILLNTVWNECVKEN